MKVIANIKAFFKDEEGASAIEYAIIAALVAGVVATALSGTTGLGTKVAKVLTDLAAKL
jgi:pilus assembly protein Flp/PilA